MKPTSYILSRLFCLAAAAVLTGCIYDTPVDDGTDLSDTGSRAMLLELNFDPISAEGRGDTNPTGGENGDGNLVGTANESEISDLTIFFYNDPDGISASSRTAIAYSVYVEKNIIKTGPNSYQVMVPLVTDADVHNGHHVIIAANLGDLTGLVTLGAVRDYIHSGHSWKAGDVPANCKNFAMANANDSQIFYNPGKYTYNGKTWKYNHRGTARLERLAARVDLLYNADQYDRASGTMKYNVYEYAEDWAWVYITNAQLFNVPVNSSFLIKRTSSGLNLGSWNYLGDETSTDGIATNYVLDPNTRNKRTGLDITTSNTWYGNSAANYVENNFGTIFKEGSANDIATLQIYYKSNAINDEYERYFPIGYTEENVQNTYTMTSQFVTGFLIRAIYQPKVVYGSVSADNEPVENSSYKRGQTFYLVTDYNSVISEKFNRYYFSNLSAANKYAEVLRHKRDDYVEVSVYTNAVCYYTVWLRHSARTERYPDIHEYCPMEYSVVRNNVYQVALTFHGPGTTRPRIDDPQSIRPYIYARQWLVNVHGQIAM